MNGLLKRVDVLIGIVFLIIFLLWSGSKCKETKSQLQDETQTGAVADSLINEGDEKPAVQASDDVLAEALRKKREEQAAKAGSDSLRNTTIQRQDSSVVAKTNTPAPAGSILYITIDKLKVRSEPGLKSKVMGELPLFSEVYFMNEVTDSIYTLSLGKEEASEPYIKIKTKKGTVGWVYGAGVNYYKKKREGVLD